MDATGNAYRHRSDAFIRFSDHANAISNSSVNPNGSVFLTEINTNATTGPLSKVYSTYFGGTNGVGDAIHCTGMRLWA